MPAGERTRISRFTKALLLSPAVVLFASAVRLLIISNYDTTTATTIAANGGVVGTLLGTLVPLLPPFLPFLVGALILVRRWALAVLSCLAAGLVSPAYTDLGSSWTESQVLIRDTWRLLQGGEWNALLAYYRWAGVAACVGGIIALVDPPARVSQANDRLLDRVNWGWTEVALLLWFGIMRLAFVVGMAIVSLFAFLFLHSIYHIPRDLDTLSAVIRRPWLPLEEITVDGKNKYVGYTITTKDGWQIVLNSDSRTISYIKAGAVSSRKVCTDRPTPKVPTPVVPVKNAHYVTIGTCTVTRSVP
jgi:hypothetical protein